MSRESRRLLVLAILVAIASALAGAWFHHLGSKPTPEEQARKKAEEVKERVRQFTH